MCRPGEASVKRYFYIRLSRVLFYGALTIVAHVGVEILQVEECTTHIAAAVHSGLTRIRELCRID